MLFSEPLLLLQLHRESLASAASRDLRSLSDGCLQDLASSVDVSRVLFYVLPATRIIVRQSDFVIELRVPPGPRSAILRFDSLEELEKWRALFFEAVSERQKNLSDFAVLRQIGKGASGRVYLVEDSRTKEQLALKVIEKKTVYESDDAYRHALDERLVLQLTSHHPYILHLRYAFQNARRLFLVTEYCPGGDLFDCMERRALPLEEKVAKIVAAEILLALEHIHSFGIVYRDLKLENILLDREGHIRIADFGLSKVLKGTDGNLQRTDTFCGTREYVAPEMIRGESYDTSLDLWAYGILLYEMLSGRTPFYTPQHNQIYKRIEKAPIFYPHHLSPEVRSLIEKLLKREPSQRIGSGEEGLIAIKKHKWFVGVDWEKLRLGRKRSSPLKLYINAREKLDQKESAPRTKDRRAYQERAMSNLLADLEEDLQYVRGTANTPAVALSRRPTSPMGKRVRSILAGYSFYEMSPKSLGAAVQTSKLGNDQ